MACVVALPLFVGCVSQTFAHPIALTLVQDRSTSDHAINIAAISLQQGSQEVETSQWANTAIVGAALLLPLIITTRLALAVTTATMATTTSIFMDVGIVVDPAADGPFF